MNWQCPECGLLNDNDLIRCPCGYEKVPQSEPEKSYEGIRGWLIIPLLGLIFSLIIGLDLLYRLLPVFSEPYWSRITTLSYGGSILIFTVSGNFVTVALSAVTLWFFFRKSRFVPKLMISWLIFGFLFVWADFFLADIVPAVAAQSDLHSTEDLGRSLIGVLIWVPYFLQSKRVKQTFVR
jgi:hypothetical protein